VELVRYPKVVGKGRRYVIDYVPGYDSRVKRYASQISRVFEDAIFKRSEPTSHFVAFYNHIRKLVLKKYPDAHPVEQQYILETNLWKRYISELDDMVTFFRCPDPRPYLSGDQPEQCANCTNYGHWWWECPQECMECASPGHRAPSCEFGLTRLEALQEIRSTPNPQAPPPPQPPAHVQVDEKGEYEEFIEEVD
jgi:hypothetical protein